MNAKRIEKYRHRLLEQFDEVSAEIQEHSKIEEPELDSVIVSSEEKLLGKIEFALMRLEQGNYGKCMGCGTGISTERLDAKPSVSLCTTCQENKEQK